MVVGKYLSSCYVLAILEIENNIILHILDTCGFLMKFYGSISCLKPP